jgi:Na+/phosphate symporter
LLLEAIQQQISEQVKNKSEEERNNTLEHNPNLQHYHNVAQNSVQTYVDAINYANANLKSIGTFSFHVFPMEPTIFLQKE